VKTTYESLLEVETGAQNETHLLRLCIETIDSL